MTGDLTDRDWESNCMPKNKESTAVHGCGSLSVRKKFRASYRPTS